MTMRARLPSFVFSSHSSCLAACGVSVSDHSVSAGILPCSQPISAGLGVNRAADHNVDRLTSAKLRPSKGSSVGCGGGSCPSLKKMKEPDAV